MSMGGTGRRDDMAVGRGLYVHPTALLTPEESFTIPISVALVGPTQLYPLGGLAMPADRRWVVTTLVLVSSGIVSATFNSALTAVTGPIPFVANQQLVVIGDAARNILRANNVGEVLTVTLSLAVQVSGWLQIREVGGR